MTEKAPRRPTLPKRASTKPKVQPTEQAPTTHLRAVEPGTPQADAEKIVEAVLQEEAARAEEVPTEEAPNEAAPHPESDESAAAPSSEVPQPPPGSSTPAVYAGPPAPPVVAPPAAQGASYTHQQQAPPPPSYTSFPMAPPPVGTFQARRKTATWGLRLDAELHEHLTQRTRIDIALHQLPEGALPAEIGDWVAANYHLILRSAVAKHRGYDIGLPPQQA